ncbi:MAG: 3-hydroxyacyl-CoA dehydrogenase family protein [Henriciella sp.]
MTKGSEDLIAVVGGGLMGYGIAFVFASAGFRVNIVEPDNARRAELPARISRLCDLLQTSHEALKSIGYFEDIPAAVASAAMVVEAAPENLAIKQSIFAELDTHAPEGAILATNTSAIPISNIAKATKRPERVLGAHFWNPPHLIELVEIIVGSKTDRAVADRAMDLMSRVGMVPVLVLKDIPGFIGNRLQHALKREAIALVANGVCDAETVDTVTKLGFGKRLPVMGPLEQSDLLGLELTVAIHETIIPDLDVTPTVHPFLTGLVQQGLTGAKAGQGFRTWTEEAANRARNQMNEYLLAQARLRYKNREGQPSNAAGGPSG